jgi:2-oxoisovalerate dehydrogenase E1 component
MNTSVIKHYRTAILIRSVEERLLELFKAGKINGTVHTCVGQEFSAISISAALGIDDYVFSNHRGHGHYIARTNDIEGLIAELMGKKTGASGGIGGSQHLINRNYLSNGIQGGMTPIACGVAFANKLRNNNNISVVFIGDGTLGEGILYETLNISALWNCPVLFVLENNQYAQSSSFKNNFSGTVKERIEGFNIKYSKTDTWDLEDLFKKTNEIVSYVRENVKPAFIEIETYRLNSHSKGDDNRFENEINEYRDRDLINIFKNNNQIEYNKIENEINILLNNIINTIEKHEDLLIIENDIANDNIEFKYKPLSKTLDSEKRINELIYEALNFELTNNKESTLIGEDIEYQSKNTEKPYGGAFKVTRDLSLLFPNRVKNTPISEAAIVGISNGLAISGYRAITEIMFGDFTTLILDQLLQHGAKFHMMYNKKINVPHVIRTPMGGKRGYGPTHSQSLEKFFLGIHDLTVVVLNNKIDPRIIYNNIFQKLVNPVLVIENKILYTNKLNLDSQIGFNVFESIELFPTVLIKPVANKKAKLTIFCYGEMLENVENAVSKAFEEFEILCEIVCPTCIHPLNTTPIFESINRTTKLLIVEEGPGFAALGSEIVARIIENNYHLTKLVRLNNDNIIPSSHKAEINQIPGVVRILSTINKIINE